MNQDQEQACALVREAQRIAAFTGAGISAESGIATFRDSDDALWRKYDPSVIADISNFRRDPTLYWEFFKEARYPMMSPAQPNAGHRALAALEECGRLRWLITQNIDGLHQAAGSQEVIELHGNTRRILCLDCGCQHTWGEVYQVVQDEPIPTCKACGGALKPDVVFFGEALPGLALAHAQRATERCDLMISIGSSLVVYPAALLPQHAKAQGARLIIVNMTPTPLDGLADVVLRAPAGEVLPVLARAAGAEIETSEL